MEWSGGGNVLLELYARFNLSGDLLVVATKLFWPDFVLYKDRIFRAGGSEKTRTEWIDALDGDYIIAFWQHRESGQE